MPYLNWVFGRYQRASKVLRRYVNLHCVPSASTSTSSFKNHHRFSIQMFKEKYDTREMVTAFASIFTHSVESNALYTLFEIGRELNLSFLADNLPALYLYSNHDSVGISPMYCFLLKPLFSHSYTLLSQANLLKAQQMSNRTIRPVVVCNPNFIKF